MKEIKTISIKTILMIVVVFLGAVPLVSMYTIVSSSIRDNILKNTTVLTQGILDQAQKYINEILKDVDSLSYDLSNNNELLSLLEQKQISEKSSKIISDLRTHTDTIGDLVLIDIDASNKSLIFNNKYPRGFFMEKGSTKEFLESQKVRLLEENHERSLWLGTPPNNSGLSGSIWNYRIIESDTKIYILGVSIDINILKDLLHSIEESTHSEVRLITSDNAIYPPDDKFFNYSFAPKSLSRSNKGRFISFSDSRLKNGDIEKLLIQLYSDPLYFYNLIVLTPEKSLLRGLAAITRTTNTALIILIFLSVVLGLISILFLQYRIKQLITGVKSISIGRYHISLPYKRLAIKEDVYLTNAITKVAVEVADNREKLKHINDNLEKRVEERTIELNVMRESLIHSEQMAVLGRHATKIAHEINNPLSISITASSHLSMVIKDIIDNFENDTLKKSQLSDFSSSALEVTDMIETNLKRASDLSTNFKNFASDQFSNEVRTINVKSYITEIIKGYTYKLKNESYIINLICKEDLSIDIYPSILYQIITNLINNSILHGFENRTEGIIDLIIAEQNNYIEIVVKDNGVGISKENMFQLYQPFFTTKNGSGGTGLGLNIIRDLIKNNLEGNIECRSTLGKGTSFTIHFPKETSK
ncbi:MAG: HAMP domain-containing histidine kinase [Spirochaetaceae bacterium]